MQSMVRPQRLLTTPLTTARAPSSSFSCSLSIQTVFTPDTEVFISLQQPDKRMNKALEDVTHSLCFPQHVQFSLLSLSLSLSLSTPVPFLPPSVTPTVLHRVGFLPVQSSRQHIARSVGGSR
eukprot:TRINITY_DN4100_c0_g2_i1.p2 TRINITY_DN4100_c0_g2~~TRINITY_DN4100_c0_g2_i1.p2  ORF type:complete len:122 (+),score=9.91 TRINITY_DN4100_c0_g2_i1:105-470(+)